MNPELMPLADRSLEDLKRIARNEAAWSDRDIGVVLARFQFREGRTMDDLRDYFAAALRRSIYQAITIVALATPEINGRRQPKVREAWLDRTTPITSKDPLGDREIDGLLFSGETVVAVFKGHDNRIDSWNMEED